MPELHIITGSNDAGKSSIRGVFLPIKIQRNCIVFDGDKLFMDKQRELWKSGITAIKEAKKIAINFVEETFNFLVENAIANKLDFAYEGHFTNDATWDIPKRFKQEGFSIHLIFLGLTNTYLSESRVIDRSKFGGHYVDPKTVAQNFYGNLEKLDKYFEIFESVKIIDSSDLKFVDLCSLSYGNIETSVQIDLIPKWFTENLPNISKIISTRTHSKI
jgi:predicted ABC-type ATPase